MQVDENTIFAKRNPKITFNGTLISLAKLSSVRWETVAFIKSGAMEGTEFGTLSERCYEQYKSFENLVASVIGNDPSVLAPGYYSKLFWYDSKVKNFENKLVNMKC